MTTTVLRTWRPWNQRLFDLVGAIFAKDNRASHLPASLDGLDASTLRDIGIGSAEMASIRAGREGQAEAMRLRLLASQGHV